MASAVARLLNIVKPPLGSERLNTRFILHGYAQHLLACSTMSVIDGKTPNLGVQSSAFGAGDATLLDIAGDDPLDCTANDAEMGPILDFATGDLAGHICQLPLPPADATLNEYTIVSVFKAAASGAVARGLFQTKYTYNWLRLIASPNTTLRFTPSPTSGNLDIANAIDGTESWHVAIVRGTPLGIDVWIDDLSKHVAGGAGVTAAAHPLILYADKNPIAFGSQGAAGVSNPCNAKAGCFALFDRALPMVCIRDLLSDPALLLREDAPIGSYACPAITQLRADGPVYAFHNTASESGSKYVRVNTKASAATSWTAGATQTMTGAFAYAHVSGLYDGDPGDQFEAYFEWSSDGLAWTPFPVGVTKCILGIKAPTQAYRFAVGFENHENASNGGRFTSTMPVGPLATRRKWLAHWMGDLRLLLSEEFGEADLDGIVMIGDGVYDEVSSGADASDLNETRWGFFGDYLAAACWMLKCAPIVAYVLGNHETHAGYHQHCWLNTAGAHQKQHTIAMKRCMPMPTHETYASLLGMESGEGGDYDSSADWKPALTKLDAAGQPFDAAYRATYIDDSLSPHENCSPLQNFYAVPLNTETVLIVLDPFTYTDPGDSLSVIATGAGGSGLRPGGGAHFTLGAVQTAWLRAVAALPRWEHKIAAMHIWLGGFEMAATGPSIYDYGRGTFAACAEAGQNTHRLGRLLWELGVGEAWGGHDHKGCWELLAAYGNLLAVKWPSTSAPSHCENTDSNADNQGWHAPPIPDAYGDANLYGAGVVQHYYNGLGFGLVSHDGTPGARPTHTLIETGRAVESVDGASDPTPTSTPAQRYARQLGQETVGATDTTSAPSSDPWQVDLVAASSELVNDWWAAGSDDDIEADNLITRAAAVAEHIFRRLWGAPITHATLSAAAERRLVFVPRTAYTFDPNTITPLEFPDSEIAAAGGAGIGRPRERRALGRL